MVATAVRAVLLAVAAWGMVGTNAADAVAAAQTRRVARIEEAISGLIRGPQNRSSMSVNGCVGSRCLGSSTDRNSDLCDSRAPLSQPRAAPTRLATLLLEPRESQELYMPADGIHQSQSPFPVELATGDERLLDRVCSSRPMSPLGVLADRLVASQRVGDVACFEACSRTEETHAYSITPMTYA
jgi:hypothetical protein